MANEQHEAAVDTKEMARILGVSVVTVSRMVRDGEIPAIKVGERFRFFPSRVIAHLEAKAAEPEDLWALPSGNLARSAGAVKAAETRRILAAERAKQSDKT
ncbi:helix-turn-helix domain-containing protein [Microbacterium sp. NPDC077663]|uniref:helix-turn-helix domain-containing protein n=1 Tax=Microbacterium sp. NPDC077663 TaxID=3364189 RepID=UPI0037CBD377